MIVAAAFLTWSAVGPHRHRPAAGRRRDQRRSCTGSAGCSYRRSSPGSQRIDPELTLVASFGVAVAAGGLIVADLGHRGAGRPRRRTSTRRSSWGPWSSPRPSCTPASVAVLLLGQPVRAAARAPSSAARSGRARPTATAPRWSASTSSARWRRCSRSAPRRRASPARRCRCSTSSCPTPTTCGSAASSAWSSSAGWAASPARALGAVSPRPRRGLHGVLLRHALGDRRALRRSSSWSCWCARRACSADRSASGQRRRMNRLPRLALLAAVAAGRRGPAADRRTSTSRTCSIMTFLLAVAGVGLEHHGGLRRLRRASGTPRSSASAPTPPASSPRSWTSRRSWSRRSAASPRRSSPSCWAWRRGVRGARPSSSSRSPCSSCSGLIARTGRRSPAAPRAS